MLSEKTKIFIVVALIAVIGAFYIATIRPGHGWGDDFALYIQHAINIVEKAPYSDTGYIYNSFEPILSGPKTYPPIFPLILAPVYKLFGLNFTAFKIEVILCFLLALFFIYLVLRKELSFKYLIALLSIIALHPFFWSFKDSVMSDFPFLLWVFLSLFLIIRANNLSGKKQLFYGVLIGGCSYLAYATRVVGIVLPACLVCCELGVRPRGIPRGLTPVALAVFTLLAVGQAVILSADGSYFNQFNAFSYQTVIISFLISAKALIFLWGSSYPAIFLGFIVALLALLGFIYRLKDKKISALEIFLILYVLIIGLWPSNQGIRFLIPIIPLYLFYCFSFLEKIRPEGRPPQTACKFLGGLPFVFIFMVFVCYVSQYMATDFGPIKEGPFKKESIELFQFIKQNTQPNDVFIFNKPLALALFTSRSASIYRETKIDQENWDYFSQISADYLVQRQGTVVKYNSHFLDGFVSRNQANLENVFSNHDFVVYKIKRKLQ
ncbi:MAG: hypothetical protein NTZ42_02745 [Candidatus Gribaldobacteria bacterium]|nr:hypothetical protein [Candidatus Gribaldobacteria bacterium]